MAQNTKPRSVTPEQRMVIERWANEQVGSVEHFHHINVQALGFNDRFRVDVYTYEPIIENDLGKRVDTGLRTFHIRNSYFVSMKDACVTDLTITEGS